MDYADTPHSMLYSYRGTLAHQVIEDAAHFVFPGGETLTDMGFLTEERMLMCFCFEHGGFPAPEGSDPYDETTWGSVVCPKCKKSKVAVDKREWFFLSGTLDGFEPCWDDFDPQTGTLPGVIFDNKTSADFAINNIISGKDAAKSPYASPFKNSHCEQLNLYAFLLTRIALPKGILDAAAKKGVAVKKLKVTGLVIQMLSMMQFPTSGTSVMFSNHYTKPKVPTPIPALPLFEEGWAEAHIKKHGRDAYKGLILEQNPAPLCAPESNSKDAHHWKCAGFCAFHETFACPSPKDEWIALKRGDTPEQAFAYATACLEERIANPPVEVAAPPKEKKTAKKTKSS
jgi:hypothetical protein